MLIARCLFAFCLLFVLLVGLTNVPFTIGCFIFLGGCFCLWFFLEKVEYLKEARTRFHSGLNLVLDRKKGNESYTRVLAKNFLSVKTGKNNGFIVKRCIRVWRVANLPKKIYLPEILEVVYFSHFDDKMNAVYLGRESFVGIDLPPGKIVCIPGQLTFPAKI